MELKRLHSDIISKIRSSTSINTVCQSVLELVYNSLDANATAVAVRINLVTLKIQVVDNGEGIIRENMELIGQRYFTNKCNHLKQLEERLKFYGFRGEALANIAKISKTINITSRHKYSSETYNKTIENSDYTSITIAKKRPSVGTTVTIEGMFYNYPVRKNRIVKELELAEIVKNIKGLIIMHFNVNFSVRDDVTTEIILNSHKSNNLITALKYLHSEIKEEGVVMKLAKGTLTINALLFKTFSETKRIQYIYVNKRPIFSPKINKIMEKLFHINVKQQKNKLHGCKMYPIYVLHIKCPYTEVDILLNPSKTMVQFKNWEKITKCIEKLMNTFFGNKISCNKLQRYDVEDMTNEKSKLNCGVSQIQGVVRAFGYKRKNVKMDEIPLKKIKKFDKQSSRKSILKSSQAKSVFQQHENYKINRTTPDFTCKQGPTIFNQPLPIKIAPKENNKAPEAIPTQFAVESNKSIFTNDGKNLIMDMFLKSTQVFKNDEDIQQSSQNSQETIYEEESNVLVENNIKSVFAGVSKSMSMSVNVKSTKKIKKNKTKNISKAVQTSFKNDMISKCIQTTVKEHTVVHDDKRVGSISPSDYTVIFSKDGSSPHFEFVFKKPEEKKKFNFAFTQNCCCNCNKNINMFNFKNCKSSKNCHDSNLLDVTDELPAYSTFLNPVKNKNSAKVNPKICKDSFEYKRMFSKTKNYNWKINRKPKNIINAKPEQQSSYFQSINQYQLHQQDQRVFPKMYDEFNSNNAENSVDKWFQAINCHPDFQHSPVVPPNSASGNDLNKYCEINYRSTRDIPNSEIMESKNINNNVAIFSWQNSSTPKILETELGAKKGLLMKEFRKWDSQFTKDKDKNDFNTKCKPNYKGTEDVPNFELMYQFPLENKNNSNVSIFSLPKNYLSNQEIEEKVNQLFSSDENHKPSTSKMGNTGDNGINTLNQFTETKEDSNVNQSKLFVPLLKSDKLSVLEKEFGAEKGLLIKEFLKWDSQFTQNENKNDLNKKCTPNYKSTRDVPNFELMYQFPLENKNSRSVSIFSLPKSYLSNQENEEKVNQLFSSDENHKPSTSKMGNTGDNGINTLNQYTEAKKESNVNQSKLFVPLLKSDKLDVLEKELGSEKGLLIKEFLKWDSQFTQDENINDLNKKCTPNYKSTRDVPNFELMYQFPLENKNNSNVSIFSLPKSYLSNQENEKNMNQLFSSDENHKPSSSKMGNTGDNGINTLNQYTEAKEDSNVNQSKLFVLLSRPDKLSVLEKELGAEKDLPIKEFLKLDSQFTHDENKNGKKSDLNWTKRSLLEKKIYANKKTGYTTDVAPRKYNNFFLLSERYEFLPKGMSPIIKETKQVDKSLSKNDKETLLEYIMETYKNDLLYVKWQHYLTGVDKKVFFENMYKAKVKMFENCIPDPNTNNKQNEIMTGVCLNKDVFKYIEVIGQVDKKFIVAREIRQNMLIIFDQHAVHERIRLEKLWKIYKNAKTTCLDKLHYFMPQHELSLLKRCESYLNFIGLTLEFFTNGVIVTEIPLCLFHKFMEEESTESLNKIIQILINEIIEIVKSTRGASLKTLPKLIQNIINLEACRGAIKFGDLLDNHQCIELLRKLSTTQLPFQCAHGRPTIIPMTTGIPNSTENAINPINYQNLKTC